MAKKHPIYHLHKIKVHNNRWLAWAIAYTIIATIAMVGYIQISEVKFGSQPSENVSQPWRTYSDPGKGFRLRYPVDWSIEAVDNSTVSFVPLDSLDEGVSVAVMDPSSETLIRKGMKISDESRVTVDGNRAVKIINDLGQGHDETVVMVLREGKLYLIRGTDRLVAELLWNFHFIK